jgi:hypothetical protein
MSNRVLHPWRTGGNVVRRAAPSRVVLLAGCALAAGFAPAHSQTPPLEGRPMPPATNLHSITEAALADAAKQTGLARSELKVISAEPVTWRDGSLGCPQPGMRYSTALVPGFRVRIQAGGRELDYHASARGRPALCPAGRAVEPLPSDAV